MSIPDYLKAAVNIQFGMFPKTIPPVFSSKLLKNWYSNVWDTQFPDHDKGKEIKASRCCRYNSTRRNDFRRWFAVPSPINHCLVSHEIESSANDIHERISRSPFSVFHGKTASEFGMAGKNRSFAKSHWISRNRANAKYILKADISRFYHSIYSHTIPWALHTKPIAKKQRGRFDLAGNRLDWAVRNCNDNQTVGIPIGPATSRVIAELVLSQIDSRISEEHGIRGIRAIDDFEFPTESQGQAEEILHTLESALRELELDLNHEKTAILPLPQTIESPTLFRIRELIPHGKPDSPVDLDHEQLRHFFNHVFNLANEHPHQGTFVNACRALSRARVPDKLWPFTRNCLMQFGTTESSSIRYIVPMLVKQFLRTEDPDRELIRNYLHKTALDHAICGHSMEVSWLIWALVSLSIPIHPDVAQKIINMRDPICSTMICFAYESGFIEGSPDLDPINSLCCTNPEIPFWLPIHEGKIRNWEKFLPALGSVDLEETSTALIKSEITLIDWETDHGRILDDTLKGISAGHEYDDYEDDDWYPDEDDFRHLDL